MFLINLNLDILFKSLTLMKYFLFKISFQTKQNVAEAPYFTSSFISQTIVGILTAQPMSEILVNTAKILPPLLYTFFYCNIYTSS